MADPKKYWKEFMESWCRMFEETHGIMNLIQKKYALTGKQFGVLRVISWVEPASIGDLKPYIPGYDSSISQIVDRLVRKGYVARDQDPKDRRKVVLSLKPKGRKTLSGVPLIGPARLMKELEAMSSAQALELVNSMRRIVNVLHGPKNARPKILKAGKRQDGWKIRILKD